jgi:acyl carrier protein
MEIKQLSENEILEILAAAFQEPPDELTRDSVKDDIPGWDSMGALVLMAEFDEKLGIELTSNAFKSMQSVGNILDFLKERGALKP